MSDDFKLPPRVIFQPEEPPAALRAIYDGIWVRHARGEITIRQANLACAEATNAALAPERERLERERREDARRHQDSIEKGRETRARRKAAREMWQQGVAKIMAEVRRREAELARLNPEPPYYSSDNPLDGERLWA